MQYEITNSPVFSKLDITLNRGEYIFAQPDSMLAMTTGIEITGKAGGQMKEPGILGGIRSWASGERFFSAKFRAEEDSQKLSLSPEHIGEIVPYDIGQGVLIVTAGSFLACGQSVEIEIMYGGLKGLFGKKGLFLMRAGGAGTLFLSSFGAVESLRLVEDEKFIVDNRYVIAFSESISWKLVKATNKISHALMSGEGFVNQYTGPGTLMFQTRPKSGGKGWLFRLLDAVS